MTPKELAEALTGIEYSGVVRYLYGSDLMKLAKAHGLVVAYGFSDDLLEFHGAMYDEVSCYGGRTVWIDASGLLPNFEDAKEDEDECRRYFERKQKARSIEAVWDGDADGYAWTINTDIPHEMFAIMEDGAGFSRGIVFALADLERKAP